MGFKKWFKEPGKASEELMQRHRADIEKKRKLKLKGLKHKLEREKLRSKIRKEEKAHGGVGGGGLGRLAESFKGFGKTYGEIFPGARSMDMGSGMGYGFGEEPPRRRTRSRRRKKVRYKTIKVRV